METDEESITTSTLGVLKLGLDFWPKNWEFRVFPKHAMSKKLELLRFRQTGQIQKISTYKKYFLFSKLIHKIITHKDEK